MKPQFQQIPVRNKKDMVFFNCTECEHFCETFRGSRQSHAIHQQLTDLLNRVVTLYSGVLEKLRLQSRIRAKAETELALIRLAKHCRRLTEFRVNVKLTERVLQNIRSTLLGRSQNILIEVNPLKKKKSRAISPKIRNRSSGMY